MNLHHYKLPPIVTWPLSYSFFLPPYTSLRFFTFFVINSDPMLRVAALIFDSYLA